MSIFDTTSLSGVFRPFVKKEGIGFTFGQIFAKPGYVQILLIEIISVYFVRFSRKYNNFLVTKLDRSTIFIWSGKGTKGIKVSKDFIYTNK